MSILGKNPLYIKYSNTQSFLTNILHIKQVGIFFSFSANSPIIKIQLQISRFLSPFTFFQQIF